MGSSYFGEPNIGNEKGASSLSSSSSSRKGKKSNSDNPKQPQRGLGVAQLERIRLYEQMGSIYHPSLHGPFPANFNQEKMRLQPAYSSMALSSSTSHGFHRRMMMGLEQYETRPNIRYGDFQPSTTSSWNPGKGILDSTRNFAQPNQTRQLLNLHHAEDSPPKRSNLLGYSSQNSVSSDTQELDLELRLSL
ncbi:TCP Interactor containing EAR motif protein 2 [Hibiscus trionum]|uniref:TCP Interactor containing EAR motif protein 2 n=1 Tax=Hibiscus trionum TaxID=183268 RepID=A0A9W7HPM3_HIBTR|nr:TCP Interactor containing EAR motif protein 2 [Hibiscus trionum]